ncbi:MAG: diacylglycerol kinase family protein [Reyranellaceae bacterium]
MRAVAIANPAARKGRCGRNWPQIEARLRRHLPVFETRLTARPGHATALARQAVQDGFDTFIAIGGDGTVNEVVNGLVENGALARPGLALCPVPAGTANELCLALGLLADADAPYRTIVAGRTRRIDLIETRCAGLAGGEALRYGYAIACFGAAAEISHRTSASRLLKRLGGRFSYYYQTLLVTLTYPYWQASLRVDDQPVRSLRLYTGLACNTRNGGGGMMLAPGASFDDGVLDLVLFGEIARRDILLQKPSWLYQGRHVEHPRVEVVRGRRFQIEGPAMALVDLDGETIGRLPMTARVIPGALAVKAPI